jgi:hypothetical protein
MPPTRRIAAVTVLGLLAAAHPAAAHPGWGLVRDPARGVVYYTDLHRVWRISPTGERSVAVPEVHTHELMLDDAGRLYGEDLEGLGGDRWRNRVWRLSADGRLEDVIPWRPGFRDDYGFVRDGAGVLYWASCVDMTTPCVVKRRTPEGRVGFAAGTATFARPLNVLAPDTRGGVLVADGADLKRITATGVEVVASGLARGGGRFAIMGFQAASDGSIHATAFEDRVVVRLAPDGTRSVVARSAAPWQPSAVLVAPDALWITEYDGSRVQLRRIGSDGRVRIYADLTNQ